MQVHHCGIGRHADDEEKGNDHRNEYKQYETPTAMWLSLLTPNGGRLVGMDLIVQL